MISVLIPTHNRENTLKRAIDSVLNQSLKAREIIVVDDGSSDKTEDILKSYEADIRVISQKNSGVSSARNRAIKDSSCKYIALLDSDDMFLEQKLELQLNFHLQNPHIKISHSDEIWIRENKEIKQPKSYKREAGFLFESFLPFCKLSPSTVMLNREIFDRVGYFDESFSVCEDYDFWLRCALEFEIGVINTPLTKKFDGEKNQLSHNGVFKDIFRIKALEKHIESRYKKAVLKELTKKITIVLKGAKKRENRELIEIFEPKLINYQTLLQNLT